MYFCYELHCIGDGSEKLYFIYVCVCVYMTCVILVFILPYEYDLWVLPIWLLVLFNSKWHCSWIFLAAFAYYDKHLCICISYVSCCLSTHKYTSVTGSILYKKCVDPKPCETAIVYGEDDIYQCNVNQPHTNGNRLS